MTYLKKVISQLFANNKQMIIWSHAAAARPNPASSSSNCRIRSKCSQQKENKRESAFKIKMLKSCVNVQKFSQ